MIVARVVIVALVTLVGAVGSAQDAPSKGTPADSDQLTGSPEASDGEAKPVPRRRALGQRELLGGPIELDEAWFGAMAAHTASDNSGAVAKMDEVVQVRTTMGVPNLFHMSDVALLLARRAAEADRGAQAKELIARAALLAPDNPNVPLLRADLAWTLDDIEGGVFANARQGLKMQMAHPGGRMLVMGRIYSALIMALYWSVIFFAVAMLARHGPLLTHDAGLLAPKSIRGRPFAVLGLTALVVAPLSVGMGLVLMGLVWLVMLWPYYSHAERSVAALMAIAVAVTPQLNGRYQAALSFAASPQADLYECYYGRCPQPVRDRLEAKWEASGDPLYGTAVALYKKRYGEATGNTQELNFAVVGFNRAVQADEQSYVANVNLANAKYSRANRECKFRGGALPRLEEIEAIYRQATQLHPRPLEAEFNRGVLLAQAGRADEAKQAFERAAAIDGERVAALQKQSKEQLKGVCPAMFNGNVHLLDALPPALGFTDTVTREPVGNGPILIPFGYLLAGVVDAAFMPMMGGVCALLLILGAFFVRIMRPAYRCHTCGRIASERQRRELAGMDICEHCLFIKIKGAFVDSRDKWLRDRGIAARDERKGLFSKVLNFLMPGFGHMVGGHPIMGLLYLLPFVFGVVLCLGAPAVLPDWSVLDVGGLALNLAGSLVLMVAYVVAGVDVLVRFRA